MNGLAILAAAASWSAPQTVSAPHTFAGPLLTSADPAGGALVAWGWQDGVGQGAQTGAGQVRVTNGALSAEQAAPDGLVAAAAYGDGRSVLLASRQVDTRGRRWRLTVRDGAATTRLTTAFILFRPQLAVAPDGTAIVAWVELRGHTEILRAATRTARGSFSRPFTLSGRGQTTVSAVAAGARHDLLVAFVRNGRVLVRVRRPGKAWGRVTTLATAHGRTRWQLSAAFDALSTARLVWRRHRFSRPGHPAVRVLEAARLGPRARRWGAVQRIEGDGASGASLAPIPGGLALAYAFGPSSAATPRVRTAGAAGGFGPARDAAAAQGGLRSVSVAADRDGALALGWVIPNPSGDGGGIGYAAAELPGTSTFGPREQVTPSEATFDMRLVTASGALRAFWTARPGGTGPSIPVADVKTLVRTAVRE
jgi:hypothetical protein